jgi:hypothetical protein
VSIDDLSLSLFPHIPPDSTLRVLLGAPANVIDRSIGCGRYQDGLGQALAASSCGCVQYTQHTDLSLSLSLSSCRDCRPEGSETIREHSYPLCPFRFLDAAIVFLESRSLFAI